MIVSKVYLADNNDVLKWVQHDLYWQLMPYLFKYARERFVKAACLLDMDLVIVEKLKNIKAFDHRVLQDTHDIIAARYRYLYDEFGQLMLFSPLSQEECYRQDWCQWFHQEIKSLTNYADFSRAIVMAVIFENIEIGYMAESQLGRFLVSHYGMEDWAFHDHYPKVYS